MSKDSRGPRPPRDGGPRYGDRLDAPFNHDPFEAPPSPLKSVRNDISVGLRNPNLNLIGSSGTCIEMSHLGPPANYRALEDLAGRELPSATGGARLNLRSKY